MENAPATLSPTAFQKFGDKVVTIVKKGPHGPRAAKITCPVNGIYFVPIEILSMCVGKDAWMKDILVRCGDCRTVVKAADLDCDMCPDCYEKAGQENAEMDGRG